MEIPTPTHVDGIYSAFASDPLVTQFLMWQPAESREDSESAMRARLRRIEQGQEYSWVLVLHETGQVFGNLGLTPRDDDAELGFVIGRDFWGRGLVAEACGEALSWARGRPEIRRVWASCDPANPQSVRVLEKTGMSELPLRRADRVRPNFSSELRDSRVFQISVEPE
jgi:ribosomal-protein-alanine N-acetyltransferase